MKENDIRERTQKAVQMKEMEKAAAVLEMTAQLKEELKERNLQSQAKDIMSTVIFNGL